MLKFPDDLRAYEHFICDMSADAVVELGVASGGSTLWFRDGSQTQRAARHRVAGARVRRLW
jgi:cephalosporin hydroxylase